MVRKLPVKIGLLPFSKESFIDSESEEEELESKIDSSKPSKSSS
jgi:hypothetical protein